MNLCKNIFLFEAIFFISLFSFACGTSLDSLTSEESTTSGTDTSSETDTTTSSNEAGDDTSETDTETSNSVTCYGDEGSIDSDVPDWIKNNFACATIYLSTEDGTDYVVIETDNLPNHASPYWGVDSPYYEAIPDGNTQQNFDFVEQDIVFKFRVTPSERSSPASSFAGVVGIALNGVAMYSGESSTGSLDDELSTLDAGMGHSTGGGYIYHYHGEPRKFESYETSLLGVMVDGYPIYGPLEEDGSSPGTGDYPALEADTYGHTHATEDFPDGIFHYHITAWDSSSALATGVPLMPTYLHGRASPSQVSN
ncbi:YHYH protein [Pseudobacteriovorax antillogorgiicola]|uniref:YHYH protein n=1 Tax=Pseudobacteriovorax antillogorgiicola TaxID=1513793 RepID=A0A1Y6C2G4_9BACT|nr:YHYH protein [Pseudobacteriovorax antillogorgiicola]TCS49759.1 YHYH protein [Pseudobacteriovorax antillogorgiicola]SMF42491.1 YHYH protein [Pseudobacteriovorax antillogorgiicola]